MRAIGLGITGIQSFTFDDLSEVATKQDIDYTLLHMTNPLISSIANNNQPYQNFSVEFFVFKLDKQFNSDERVIAWDELEALGHEVIKELIKIPSEAMLVDNIINITRGHMQMVDSLVGVKFGFNLRFFECR